MEKVQILIMLTGLASLVSCYSPYPTDYMPMSSSETHTKTTYSAGYMPPAASYQAPQQPQTETVKYIMVQPAPIVTPVAE